MGPLTITLLAALTTKSANAIIEIPLERKLGINHKDLHRLRNLEAGGLERDLASDQYTQDLENWDNYQYVGKLWLGSH